MHWQLWQWEVLELANLALEAVGRERVEVGRKVLALYDGGDPGARGAWYSARVLEEAGEENMGRVCVRWEDGMVGWCDHEQVKDQLASTITTGQFSLQGGFF